MIKIGIYSICKNEEKNVKKWYDNIKYADYTVVYDTGSSDNTVEMIKSHEYSSIVRVFEQKNSENFSFDNARNSALERFKEQNFVDCDYVVWVDFDETFSLDWIDKLKNFLNEYATDTQLPSSIRFNNNFEETGHYWYQTRVHRLTDYSWKYCAHEVLIYTNDKKAEKVDFLDILIQHPCKSSRNDYTELLELSHEKYNDGRTSYYLGREYYYNLNYERAAVLLDECLFVHNGWNAERGEAARMLSEIYQEDKMVSLQYLHFYLAHCILQREPYLELAKYYYTQCEWASVIYYANQALEINQEPRAYLRIETSNYTHVPHDYLCIAYDRLGEHTKAAYHANKCLEFEPENQRFQYNLKYLSQV
ncbi:glycosyltransferase [Vibrio brasiliensis]|uniref:tetratricopeptide repeat-containing glycosyltransferase n=1 Tax=Vibrio brasiliensis TaxID=170652 RepID=UPI001EFE60E3|nr:glycosyltransferase [Vibrio brasiliensis]MCG9781541.1 glycosyltransferase [Vibrio brasiliensis]